MTDIDKLCELTDEPRIWGALQELKILREEKTNFQKNWVKQEFARLDRKFEEVGRNERLR